MAKSGSFNTTGYQGRNLKFSWSIASQDITNNKTVINWSLEGDGTGAVSWYYTQSVKVVIDGSTVYSMDDSSQVKLYDGTVVASGQKTISHNADGTRSFSASVEAGIYVWAVNCTGSGTFTIDTIPRASTFTVSNASADMGTSVTFNITRASTAFTHKLTLTWGGVTSNIATGVGTSQSWTIPLSLANDLPNSLSSGCIITCITYNGSTEIGRKTLSMTLKVPSSIVPSISSVTISEAVSGLATKFGAYIQNKSKLKVVTAAAGSYSSTIKTYSVVILGKTYTGSTITSDVIGSSGSVSIKVTVTDSRGRTATTTKTVTITAYADPSITRFTAQRCESDGTLNDDGVYVKLSFAFAITALSNKNDKSYTIGYKLQGDESYTTITSGSVYTLDTSYISTIVFSGDNSYDFNLTVTDYFKPVNQFADIPTAFTLVDYHSSGTGLSFGEVSTEENTFTNALDFKQKGNSYTFQPSAFNGDTGYTVLAVITLTDLNVNAPIVFVINRRGALCPMTVYVKFASSSTTTDPELETITYEGDNYGVFLVKTATSTWTLYVDNTSGWSNPCVQKWFTTDNQNARLSVTFPSGQEETLPTPYYRATPATMQSLLDYIYPVGTIYWNYSHVSPASFLGGTWTRISETFLWAAGSNGTIGGTGGAKTVTLTKENIPPHGHYVAVGGGTTDYGTTRTVIANFNRVTAGYTDTSTILDGSMPHTNGQAHNNMPPYIQVSVWRRTA